MFRRWRRSRLARKPAPAHWAEILAHDVPFFGQLSGDERARLLDIMKVFAHEKYFIGAQGFEITEDVPVIVSACAARLVLDLDVSYYDRLTEIVVYPGGFNNPLDEEDRDGEAHDWGIVVLAWDAVLDGLDDPHDGYNTAFHEFAHVLDRADGEFDGTPKLHRMGDYALWGQVMEEEYARLQREEGMGTHPLDDYGAESEAEFFAVATEVFFEDPDLLRRETPKLWREFRRFYNRIAD